MGNERRIEYTTTRVELDEKTSYADHKKNRVSGYIRSIRVGRASSPNAIFKVRMKEGDEIILWPGRIINFSERSEGAVFSWDSLPNEWAEIEISESSYFVAGESSGSSGSSGGVASEFRKSVVPLLRYYDPITYVETFTKEKILSVNDKRIYAIIENMNPDPIIIGSSENIDNSISSLIRQSTSIKIMPFSKLKIEITGELYAIRDSSYYGSSGQDYDHNIYITEFLA